MSNSASSVSTVASMPPAVANAAQHQALLAAASIASATSPDITSNIASGMAQQDAMTASTGTAAPAQLQQSLAEFSVNGQSERQSLLESLRQRQAPVIITCPEGLVISTTVWAVDAQQQTLSFSARDDSHQLDTLVESEEVMAVAYLERVKLQFDLHDLVLVRGATARALQCRMPQQMYRFQRRGAYRVTALTRQAPTARFRHPALPEMMLGLRLLDVSLGGCSLWLPSDVPMLQPGTTLAQARIELDANTQFAAELSLRHVESMGCIEGSERGVRLGCAWRPLQAGALRDLQRWIDQAQKRTRLLASP